MRGRELNLRKSARDIFFFQQVLTKQDFSDSFWTKFGLCRKGLKLAKYATDNEVIIKQVI